MKFIKGLLVSIFVILLLSAGAVYVVVTFYKKELTELLTNTLKEEHGIDLSVSDVDVSFLANWPQASVQLRDVEVRSTAFKNSYIKAGTLGLTLNVERMLNKEFIVRNISLKDGEIYFIKDTASKKVVARKVRPDTVKPNPLRFEINKILFKNVAFSYINPARGQRIKFDLVDDVVRLKHFEDGLSADLKGRVFVHGLRFKENRGEFLARCKTRLDLNINYFNDNKTFCVLPGSSAELNGDEHLVTALLSLGDVKRLALMVESKQVDVKKTSALFNAKIKKVMNKFELSVPVDVKTLLVVNIGKKEDPAVIITCSGKKAEVTIGESAVKYNNVSFDAKIVVLDSTGQRGSMENARVDLTNVSGSVYEMPFNANISIHDFSNPFVRIKGKMFIDAEKAALGLKNEFILKGHALAYLRYSGLIEHMNRGEFLGKGMKLNAEIQMKNLSYRERTRPYVYIINGKANVNNKDLKFEKLGVNTDVCDATVKGNVEGFVDYVLGRTRGFKANIDAYTDSLNINPVLAKMTTTTSSASPAGNSTSNQIKDERPAEADTSKRQNFDKDAYSSFEFDVKLFAEKMFIRKVEADDAKMILHYKNEHLDIRSLRVRTCGGKIVAKGGIKDFNKINATVNVEDVDVTRMFRQFEDFGQKAVQSHHLSGKLSMQASFKTLLDDKMEVAGETMFGEVQLKLTDGHLLNFEPIQKLSNFLLKNRDFNDVSFSELNETFTLRGYEMQIDELEIASNILNLYVVNGFYNFKGESNINVLVPWSNLRKRDKNHIPKRSGIQAADAKGVKVNFSGYSNNLKISLGHKDPPQLKPSI